VGRGWSNNAYQIDIIQGDKVFPIICDVFDAKLCRDTGGAFRVAARDGHDARAFAIAEAGNLRRAGKPGTYNPNANCFVITIQPLAFLIKLSSEDIT